MRGRNPDTRKRTTTIPNISSGLPAMRSWLFVPLFLALFLAALLFGSVAVPAREIWLALTFQAPIDPAHGFIVEQIRLPRAITAALAGSALALAGLHMQTVFRNPLADPYILGVNSGASLGVALVLLVATPLGGAFSGGSTGWGSLTVAGAASVGAGFVLAVILILAKRVSVMTLLIIGLMIAYLINALVSLLLFFAMPEQLQSFLSWSFGQFGSVTWSELGIFGPVAFGAILLGALQFKSLDALLLGEDQARLLGENVEAARLRILGTVAILAGTVTAFCGPIGFLGVAVPHLARGILRTRNHRVLMVPTLLMGASLALFADLIARLPGSTATLPVNAVTALVGAPVILTVLLRGRKGTLPA